MAFGMELVDENKICIVGGISSIEDRNLNFSSTSLLDDVWCFNVHNKMFAEITKLRLPSPRASFGLIRHRDELLLIGGLQISDAGGTCNSKHPNEMNSERKVNTTKKNGLPVTTSDVLACRLLRSASEWPQFANCKLQERDPEHRPIAEHYWYLHSKLNQQRIFPSVSRLSADDDTLLVAGGKTQDHFYLKKTSLANYCSTYEVLNSETLRWVESPMMFATFGSGLISL